MAEWEKIENDIINMFLQRLYEHCGNSIFKMEELMKDVALSGLVITEYCGLKEDCHYYKRVNDELKDEKNNLKIIINKLLTENKKLKENSVLFSMDL